MDSAHDAEEVEAAASGSALDARWMHDVRIRALARRDHAPDEARPLRRAAWGVALALHVLLIAAMWRFSPPHSDVGAEQAIIIDLIQAPPPVPPEPQPPVRATAAAKPPIPRVSHSAPTSAEPHEPSPAVAPLEYLPVEPAPEPRLFAPDGTALVPDDLASRLDREQRQKQGFIAAAPAPSPLFARKRPLKVRPNHFAQYWDGTDGMPLHDRIWRYVTATHEFTAPWGGRWKCAYVLMIVACADVPDKPWIPPQTWKPATELDEE